MFQDSHVNITCDTEPTIVDSSSVVTGKAAMRQLQEGTGKMAVSTGW